MTTSEQSRLLGMDPGPSRTRRTTSKRANELDGATWTKYSISVWDDIRKTPEEVALKHPAMFPSQLASRLIQCFTTNADRLILDPFAGAGSTVVAAESLGKVGVGLEISPEFVRKAHERGRTRPLIPGSETASIGERQVYLADANDLLDYIGEDSVDFVVTSPPYWDILLQERTADNKEIRHYGEDERDLGRIRDYNAFLEALQGVFAKIYVTLKAGKYCCVVVMDIRKKDKFYPYHSDLAGRLQDIGFIYDDLIIWDRGHEYNNLRPLGHPSVFRINKVHEYILILKKPESGGHKAG